MFDAYVRAKTSDDRWASVNVADLDERSWRRLIASKMVDVGILAGVPTDVEDAPLTTLLTKEQAES